MTDQVPAYVPATQLEAIKAMRQLLTPEDPSSWDRLWKAGVTPWDSGEVQPPLKEAIEGGHDGIEWPTSGSALVPGCGSVRFLRRYSSTAQLKVSRSQGHDVVYLASTLGIKAIGLESSQTAVDKATAAAKANPLPKGEVNFALADFFAYHPDEPVELVYDYTFFVAIPPSRRLEWGKKMAELIKPGGYLITLVFPIGPPTDVGPPFHVRPDHYDEPLSSAFEKIVDRDPTISSPTHVGHERLLVWRRKIT
ncbi:putative thiol methyltransferase 2 [Leucoagaricus sp. SymC.cos]|nr:putative thiol methyltransferase 2 [Leucoagaricus sp. SymC.cos]